MEINALEKSISDLISQFIDLIEEIKRAIPKYILKKLLMFN
ncbi:MAG: hypothetical protein ACTSWR_02500 [Candidatus Helarchaeota archaeon]